MSTGTIFDIKKFAIQDGPGIRTTVFLKGCPLGCWLCHNPESQTPTSEILLRTGRCDGCGDCLPVCAPEALSVNGTGVTVDRLRCDVCGACADACVAEALEVVGREVAVADVMAAIERDVAFYDESGGGVTFSGGEPFEQPDFLHDLLVACKERGIHTAVDTSGFVSREVLERSLAYVDLLLYDLKVMDSARHLEFTGVPNEPIHDNLRWLSAQGVGLVVRVPLLPGINDDDDNVMALGRLVASLPNSHPIDILPYHRIGIEKYARLDRAHRLPDLQPPPDVVVATTVRSLCAHGLQVTVRGEEYPC